MNFGEILFYIFGLVCLISFGRWCYQQTADEREEKECREWREMAEWVNEKAGCEAIPPEKPGSRWNPDG